MLRVTTAVALILASPLCAQNTCFTNPQGTTICSTSGGVIHGNTNSVGNSVYRDERGNRLDFQTDAMGNAKVTTADGQQVQWSQSVLGEKKYPDFLAPSSSRRGTPIEPALPGYGAASRD